MKTTAKKLIRDVTLHLDQLQQFEGKGAHPKAWVRQHASRALTDLRDLALLLGFIDHRSQSLTRGQQLKSALH